MSDDESTQGVFRRHRKKIWTVTGLAGFVVSLWMLSAAGWIPDLSFLMSPMMAVLYVSAFGVLSFGYAVHKMRGGDNSFPLVSGGTSVERQLSKRDAKLLAKWDLFEREEPIFIKEEIRCNVKPVNKQGEEGAIRVFEWVFRKKDGERVAYQMSLDQYIEFDHEWFDLLTEENMEKVNEAVRAINNSVVIRESAVRNWDESLAESREEIGQAVRQENVIEYLDQGEVKRREHRSVQQIPVGTDRNRETGDTVKSQDEDE